MANEKVAAQEVLLDVSVAEASRLYKFYLNQESKILGTAAVFVFLLVWELMGGALSVYNPIPFLRTNPMFMSAPSLIFKAAVACFRRETSIMISKSAASSFLGICPRGRSRYSIWHLDRLVQADELHI